MPRTRLLCLWNSTGKNTAVGSHSLLQGIFLTQESNLGLLHCRQILYRLSHQGLLSGVLGTGLPGLGTEHLPGALCSGRGFHTQLDEGPETP